MWLWGKTDTLFELLEQNLKPKSIVSKGTLEKGHARQVAAKYRFNIMKCTINTITKIKYQRDKQKS
jgi:hypothetical protein